MSFLIIAANVDHRELSSVLCDDLEGRDGGWSGWEDQEGGDMCIIIAAPFCCTAETNTILSNNYTPIIIIIKNSQDLFMLYHQYPY